MNGDPAVAAKRSATVAAWSPERKRKKVAHLIGREIPPEEMERRRANAIKQIRRMQPGTEARIRGGRTRTEKAMGWCPPERRDEYRRLVSNKVPPSEARAIIEREIVGTKAHAERAVANTVDAARIIAERRRQQEY